MKNQYRNLHPTKEARVAMIVWGEEYSQQNGGSMDFWDKLDEGRRFKCFLVTNLFKSKLRRRFK